MRNAARNREVPGDQWKLFPLRKIMYKTESWEKTNRKIKAAELT